MEMYCLPVQKMSTESPGWLGVEVIFFLGGGGGGERVVRGSRGRVGSGGGGGWREVGAG